MHYICAALIQVVTRIYKHVHSNKYTQLVRATDVLVNLN